MLSYNPVRALCFCRDLLSCGWFGLSQSCHSDKKEEMLSCTSCETNPYAMFWFETGNSQDNFYAIFNKFHFRFQGQTGQCWITATG